jgi:UDP-N-acetylglucosamine--N-acetylmuramyl-(pentapeptide) pyrophosphoryl-undecaprenol N-acetylglucosamine transferase
MKILIAAGGSGGHLIPALTIAKKLISLKPAITLILITSKSPLDQKIIKRELAKELRQKKVTLQPINTGKLRRYFSLRNIVDFFRFLIGIFQSYWLIKKFQPQIFFSKGGFVALPVGIAASWNKTPIILHESDTRPGLANRLLSKKATLILAGFPHQALYPEKTQVVGNPVRKSFKAPAKLSPNFFQFKNPQKPTVVFIGGSQGAQYLNQLASKIAAAAEFNLGVISGEHQLEQKDNLQSWNFLEQVLPSVLAAADLVVTRGGASVLSELALLAKPIVIIPLPTSANDHQRANAQIFAQQNAALVFEQSQIDPQQFGQTLNLLIKDQDQLKSLKNNIYKLAPQGATQKIVEQILSLSS